MEAVPEIRGSNTGHDVIAAVEAAVMNPVYRAGVFRQQALAELERLERETGKHSVVLGHLGLPEPSKLLWKVELLKIAYGTLDRVLAHSVGDIAHPPDAQVQAEAGLRQAITAIEFRSFGRPVAN